MNKSNKITLTKDGSETLFSSRFNEHYHSVFGAIQESNHIFIDTVLKPLSDNNEAIKIFEVGFGTGLNALLTYKFITEHELKTIYHSTEAYPIDTETASNINYPDILGIEKSLFLKMHGKKDEKIYVSENFNLTVFYKTLQQTELEDNYYNGIYFDAFSPETQPEMWQQSCFEKMFKALKPGGILSTYSSKGIVKRALRSAGFTVKRLPGPPGKREFLKAVKPY